MRLLYTLLVYLIAPLAVMRLIWRGIKSRGYWQRWPERFGFIPAPPLQPVIWLHAVSVGEAQAAAPLVRALQQAYPALPIAITTTTPTGSQRVRETYGDEVFHTYLPFDLPDAVARFLDRLQPKLAVIMETELWPNLYQACTDRGIPLVLANGRLSRRSAAGYRKIRPLIAGTLQHISAIAAQGRGDAERFIGLGADPARVHVTGNIKFDLRLPASLREEAAVLRREFGTHRPVWVAASTHEGEEEQVLDAFQHVRHSGAHNALLVLVPRHPERFGKVAALCDRWGYKVVRRTEGAVCDDDVDVFLGDTLGELPLFYAASDVAFVGGSLVPVGGHNPLEPAALGLPVIYGPHMFNFEEISELLLEADAARQVQDAEQLAAAADAYLRDANLRHATGERGRETVEKNRGALESLLAIIKGTMVF